MVLLGYHFEIETKSLKHRFDDYTASPVQRRIDNLQRFRFANDRWIKNERSQSAHVRFVDVRANHFYLTLSVFWERRIGFGGDRVRAHARKFGPFACARVPALGGSYDFSNGPPAKPARSKRKRPVKAVVQFLPFCRANELINHSRIKIRRRSF